ncbi:MAG: hypothetical protein SVJ22_02940 [Halobacteriota archaeon]|nr:hypothetical protein [Halobacteriota archaeon]
MVDRKVKNMSEMQQIEKNEVPKRDPAVMCNTQFHETSLYKGKDGVCEGKLIVKEPVLMSSENLKVLTFLPSNKIHHPTGYDWKLKSSNDDIPFCLYLCEHGHVGIRPADSADVPMVPPGTIIGQRTSMYSKPQSWYVTMPPEERTSMWNRYNIKFTPVSDIPDNVKKFLNLSNYENNK